MTFLKEKVLCFGEIASRVRQAGLNIRVRSSNKMLTIG